MPERIQFANLGATAAVAVENDRIAFATILPDLDAGNPLTEMDGNGEIFSLDRRHANFDPDRVRRELDSNPDAVPLSYYEHSASFWFPREGSVPAGVEFVFDGIETAGVWVPDRCALENIGAARGKTRKRKLLAYAAVLCEVFTAWANGWTYGYEVQVYSLIREAETDPHTGANLGIACEDLDAYHESGCKLFEDSCFGYYGLKDVEADAAACVADALRIP